MMHAYALPYFLLLLLVCSFLDLPNPILVQGRNLIASKNVFKVDFIHRDSPLSPYYDSSITPQERLKRAPLGSISRGHKIHLSSKYYDTLNDAKLSDLIPNGGDYLIKIALGTPQVEFTASADTGSDLIWVQCSPCVNNTCIPQTDPLFDPSKSSTFDILPCTSPKCAYPDLTSGCLSNNTVTNTTTITENISNDDSSPCIYDSAYGDGTESIGVLATETLSLPSSDANSLSLPSSVFGCGLAQQGRFGTQGDGIVGLGTGPASLISQLGQNINYKFSYCLAPLTSGVNSKLTFGADVMGPRVVSTPFKYGQPSTFYYLTLESISVEGENKPVQVPVSDDIIIDSGTTLTFLPTSVYDGIRAALISAIGLSPVLSPRKAYDLCYDTPSSGQINPPDVVFHFKGANVVLKATNTFRNIGNGVTCLAMVASDSTPIFGNIAQVNFQVGYDLKAQQVSFAPTDCTTH